MAIKFSSDWESGTVNNGWQVYEYPANNPTAMSRSNLQARLGTWSNRITLSSTDDNAQFGNRRTELTKNNSTNPDTTYRWYGFSYYFPSATYQTDSKEHVIIQWHDKAISPLTCSSSPTLAIEVKNDSFRAAVRYNLTNPYCSNNTPVLTFYPLGAIPKDQWVDFVIYYYPSANTDGEIKIWINNELKLNYTGRCMYFGSYFPYLKIGIYKWLWNGSVASPLTFTNYLDALKIGDTASSYNEVAPAGAPVNEPPIVSAGANQVVPSSTTTINLSGTATDGDGTIASTTWTRVSGPNTPTITNASNLSTTVTGCVPGTYTFRLSATDNLGAVSTATCIVRVNALPIINLAGNTVNYSNSTTSISLTSVVTDPDGVITSYTWEQIKGPTVATISTPSAANTTIGNLQPGTYRFSLSANDNDGEATASSIDINIALLSSLSCDIRLIQI